ncbi:MAG: geopeptide radical SAM maturase [Candidatus Methylomirabilia bacterium]
MLTWYCRIFSSPEHPGKVVLFSTRTAATLLVPASLIDEIGRDSLSAADRAILAAHGFLVEDAAAEKREMRSFLSDLAAMDKVFKPVVVLNLDCNLACTYCFEGQRKGKLYLSEQTADQLLAFIRDNGIPGRQEVNVTFYGGEPLLSMERMVSLSGRIGVLAAAAGIPFSFSMITNGTLLTRRNVQMLRPLGLRSVSVTLDGPRDTHDAVRPFRSGNGSYDAILRNLKEVHDLVDLKIGGNYQRENYREFPRLLDDLAANGLTPAVISHVRFDPVVRERDGIAPPDFHGGCTTINESWIYEASIFLREEILRRGYRISRIMPAICMVDFPGQMVIGHDGGIYKCSGLIGRKEFQIGDLEHGITDVGRSHNLGSWKNDTCLSCPYLPLCFGGCRYLKLLRDGDMSGVDCRKPYFDAVLEPLVMQDLRHQ